MNELPEHITEELAMLCAIFSFEHKIPVKDVTEFVEALFLIVGNITDEELTNG